MIGSSMFDQRVYMKHLVAFHRKETFSNRSCPSISVTLLTGQSNRHRNRPRHVRFCCSHSSRQDGNRRCSLERVFSQQQAQVFCLLLDEPWDGAPLARYAFPWARARSSPSHGYRTRSPHSHTHWARSSHSPCAQDEVPPFPYVPRGPPIPMGTGRLPIIGRAPPIIAR